MSNKSTPVVATMGIDIGKNSFHVVGLDRRGAIVVRQKWSRGQLEARLGNLSPCLIGMEAWVGAYHLSYRKVEKREIQHDADTHERRTVASGDLVLAGTDQPPRTP